MLLLLSPAPAAQFKITCQEPLLNAGWQPAAFNHILEAADGGYEVLLPISDQGFKIVKVQSLSRARLLARSIEQPLDLRALIAARTPDLEQLLSILRNFHREDDSISISARTKEPDSLKRKVFDRVKKRGEDFRISDIDDLVGARLAVPTLADVDDVAAQLKTVSGLEVLKYEPIHYERGYRAIHVTVRTAAGAVFEVQVMTRRMLAWVTWNAKRVYKPGELDNQPYLARLKSYDREVVNYLNALDDGQASLPSVPSPVRHHLLPEDEFPAAELR